jgi:CBS domain-containing protein
MRRHQLRRIPVVNERGRCVGIVALADVAPAASPGDVARTLREISKCSIAHPQPQPTERHDYCGQLHELDQIASLERRRSEEIPEEVLP